MKILLYSDTHHNAWRSADWPREIPEHDVMVLAGDISEYPSRYTHSSYSLPSVLGEIRSRTDRPILFLPGNHEFYHQEYFDLLEQMRKDTESLDIVFLHCRRVQIGDVAFHGCTLWSDFMLDGPLGQIAVVGQAKTRLVDFRYIRYQGGKYTPANCMALHRKERDWLDASLQDCNAPHKVVVTHFAPTRSCISPRYEGDSANPYFIANCDDLAVKYAPDLWLYGHTHTPADFLEEGTRFVNQARGYPGEPVPGNGFDTQKVLEVGSTP